ncbi:hypothetical protein [Maritimibacter sp. HL-12]|uniref:hypothetical protein n=1 Tax=Maritimibacter sp. HL-12 TaxID=1162418 RepID=UPI000A0F3A24|nr:hypothetical protein [Maritimibacter sp. HL-12]SMH36066.1 hypothetical protein SAMN05661107_0687 [Maritimibacter sp. HL-12]
MSKDASAEDYVRGVVALGLIGLFAWFYFTKDDTANDKTETVAPIIEVDPEEAARKAAEEAEEKRYGQHCLSPWDGSQTEFVRRVKNRLNDPKSFDHVETRTWPVDPEGRNRLLMTFRAQNAFGGVVLSKAIGTFDNETCDATVEAIE